ncbi:hypothetical protein GA0070616_2572 [Micromonospora nigra]|uniref:Uncharacterized protein n=1 Tax=Micromonospora nigra TaxID=145857 RepID=A0A1C6RZH3_9ACTN|nr:hypothetical protein [Micromonospora nigra]SCL22623.1 hypothetical protein GA0070616_2572 [Micromonospora nigra]
MTTDQSATGGPHPSRPEPTTGQRPTGPSGTGATGDAGSAATGGATRDAGSAATGGATRDAGSAATGGASTDTAGTAEATVTGTTTGGGRTDVQDAGSATADAPKTGAAGPNTVDPTGPKTGGGDTDSGGTDSGGTGAKPGETTERAKADASKSDGGRAEGGDAAAKGDTGGGGGPAGQGAGGTTADPWAAFAPVPDTAPTRLGRVVRRVGRVVGHEWTLAALASLALAVLLTWPTLRYPQYTLPQDYWDPSLQAWQMAWSGHILLTNPAQLWHANTFYPEQWSFAFSDTLLGYAPAGMIGTGPEAAILRYNIMFVLAHALATFGAYALARQLGAGRIGAAVAGVSFTYAPWMLAQAGHLHVVSNGGIPLALAMLARGHGWSLRHGYRPERRRVGWVYAGWLTAAWQLSLGFGIGLPFAYVLAGTVLVAAVTWYAKRIRGPRRPFGRPLFVADLIGGLVFAGVGALMAIPYFKVAELHPHAERSIGDISIFSPPAGGFFTAPAESRVWGSLHEGARAVLPWHPEMTLLPGFVLYALAAGGLFFSVWRVRHRLVLLAGVLVAMILAMGTQFFDGTFTYVPLFEHLPGWNGIRTPGRLMLWATLLLGVLAAGAVSAFAARVREISAERIPSWPSPWLRLATLLPLLLVVVEGLNTTPHPVVPPQPAVMRTLEGPLLVLPTSQNHDQPAMLWSTSRFQDMVNGGSGFTPLLLEDVRRVTIAFPDRTSVEYLRTLGVRTVVMMRDQVAGTPWEVGIHAPVNGLDITREEYGRAVIFHL